VLDQVEEGWLGPVDVVEHDDHGTLARQVLEEFANAPEGLFGRHRLVPGHEAGDERDDPVAFLGVGDE
jgi:hypothetical protein